MQPITLNFNGKSVRLLTLLEQLKMLPTISVSHDELAKDHTFANRSRAADDSEEEVSVYKQDGAYIVLTGRKFIDAAWAANKSEFRARLLSKHALKHMQTMGEDTKVKVPTSGMRPPEVSRPQAFARQNDHEAIGDQIRQGFAAARQPAVLLDKNRQR